MTSKNIKKGVFASALCIVTSFASVGFCDTPHTQNVSSAGKIFFIAPHPDDTFLTYSLFIKSKGAFYGSEVVQSVYVNKTQWQENVPPEKKADLSPEYITEVTNLRTQEENNAMLFLFGDNFNNLRIEKHGYPDAPIRHYVGDKTAGGGPEGTFKNFREQEKKMYLEITEDIKRKLEEPNCHLYTTMAVGSHIDHFIVREAVIKAAYEMSEKTTCKIFFAPDEPYYGAFLTRSQQEVDTLSTRLGLTLQEKLDRNSNQKIEDFKRIYTSQYALDIPTKQNLYFMALQNVDYELVYSWNPAAYGIARTHSSCTEKYCQLERE